jgi:hypothetical protein
MFSQETQARWKARGADVQTAVSKNSLNCLRQRKKDASSLKSRCGQELFKFLRQDKLTAADIVRVHRALCEMPDSSSTPEKHDALVFAAIAFGVKDDRVVHTPPREGVPSIPVVALQYVVNHCRASASICETIVREGLFFSLLQLICRRVSTTGTDGLEIAGLAAQVCAEVLSRSQNHEQIADGLFVALCGGLLHKCRFCVTRLASRAMADSLGTETTVKHSVLLFHFVKSALGYLQESGSAGFAPVQRASIAMHEALKETELCGCVSVIVSLVFPSAVEQQALRRMGRHPGTPMSSPGTPMSDGASPRRLEPGTLDIVEAGLDVLTVIGASALGRELVQSTLGPSAGGAAPLELVHVLRTIMTFFSDGVMPSRVIDLVLLFLGQYTLCCPPNQALLCWGAPTMLQMLFSTLPVRYSTETQGQEVFFSTLLAACSILGETPAAATGHSIQRIICDYIDCSHLREFVSAHTGELSAKSPSERARARWVQDNIARVPSRFRLANRMPMDLWEDAVTSLERHASNLADRE